MDITETAYGVILDSGCTVSIRCTRQYQNGFGTDEMVNVYLQT